MTHGRKQKKIWKSIGDGFKSVAHPIEHAGEKMIDLPSHAIDKIGNVAQSMSLPLILIGGVVLLVYLKNN